MASAVFNGNERATEIFTSRDGVTCVVYHDTAVVEFDEEEIFLDSGGWRTNTTKHRMNQASRTYNLGYRVYQKDFDWFVSFKGEEVTFEDGMRLVR